MRALTPREKRARRQYGIEQRLIRQRWERNSFAMAAHITTQHRYTPPRQSITKTRPGRVAGWGDCG